MKYLLSILCFSIILNANAQDPVSATIPAPEVPLEKESGRVVYTNVKQAGGSQAELYGKIQSWFKGYFKNPNEVIKERDGERSMVIGKHGINIYRDMAWGKEITQQKVGMVKYRIKVIAKDGRYKYRIDEIYLVKGTKEYVEMWLDKKLTDNEMNQNHHFLTQVDEHMRGLIEDLHELMSAAAPEAPEEW